MEDTQLLKEEVESFSVGVVATPSPNSISLTWTADTGAVHYETWASRTQTGTYFLVGLTYTNAFTHQRLNEDQTFWYKVRSNDGTTDGSFDTPVSATTTKAPPILLRSHLSLQGDSIALEFNIPVLPKTAITGISAVNDSSVTLVVSSAQRRGDIGRDERIVDAMIQPAQPKSISGGADPRVTVSYS